MNDPKPTETNNPREALHEVLGWYLEYWGSDNPSIEADAMVDAYAHELAEKIRAAHPGPLITPGGPFTNGQMFAADLIDPEAQQ